MACYYGKFISHFGGIPAPLTKLLTKDGFQWSSESAITFHILKHDLTTMLVLGLLEFFQPFIIECDASQLLLVWYSINKIGPLPILVRHLNGQF